MIAAHPWFGVGLGAWPTVYPSYAIADFGVFANQAHSDWLEWTAEGGLPLGLVAIRGSLCTHARATLAAIARASTAPGAPTE